MARLQFRQNSGFTILELLVVMVIFGIFMSAVYSLYITHLRTALSREEVIDVQQNVRIAMDRITRDVRTAGFLSTSTVENTMSNYSTINIPVGSAEGVYVTISGNVNATFDGFLASPTDVLTNIKPGIDTVNIVRPNISTELIGTVFNVLSSSSVSGHMRIAPAATKLKVGDMICKNPSTILYRVDRNDTIQGCDKAPCLRRNGEIIAQGINNIYFEYFLDNSNSTPVTNVSDSSVSSKVSAIRVTVIGQTSKKVGIDNTIRKRELKSLIKLRNFKKTSVGS